MSYGIFSISLSLTISATASKEASVENPTRSAASAPTSRPSALAGGSRALASPTGQPVVTPKNWTGTIVQVESVQRKGKHDVKATSIHT